MFIFKVPSEGNNDANSEDVIEIAGTPLHSTTSKRKKHGSYLKSWEEETLLKTWIRKGQNDFPFCRICNCELKAKAGIADLKAHAKTLKHIERAKAIEIQAGSSSVLVNASKFNDKVTNIELHLAAFCVEHNVPFSAMDHLVLMLQNTIQDSDLIKKKLALKRKQQP